MKKNLNFRRTVLARSVLAACGASALAFMAAQPVLAQTAPTALQRVEITGSSIKRITAEGALPVSIITAEEIKASGATSAVDLVKRLTSAQGSTVEAAAVGSGTSGFSGISIHNIGETRTLVLLNGKRLSQFGGQALTGFGAGFDLNSIPLSAIAQIELLTDGASALYGADAIAGVVNFITKRNSTDGDVTIGFSQPAGGAEEKRISATKGFGTLEKDGFNVMLSFAHDERTQLFAADRKFGATGTATFEHNGQQYRKQQFSRSPIPANVRDSRGQLINPFQKTTGACAPKSFRVIEPFNDGTGRVNDYCGFDFVGELEIYPERKRDNFLASAVKKIGDHELYADVLFARTQQISRIAPVPGSIAIPAGSPLHSQYLLPLGITGNAVANYRLFDLGKRASDDTSEFTNLVLGSKGLLAGWDYNAYYTRSVSDVKGNIGGYPGDLAIVKLRRSGLLNPFVGPGQQTPAAQAAINATSYNGYWDGGVASLDVLALSGSREVGKLSGGAIMLGTGINFNKESFESKPSLFAQGQLADPVAGILCNPAAGLPCDVRFGDPATTPVSSASRTSQGIFGELVLPVAKNLELGAAIRYDNYSDFGNATTAKGSFRWTPTSNFLVRGSVGTGFKAPTVPQVNFSLRDFGVTGNAYLCTPALQAVATAKGAVCQPGNAQYDQFAGGNPALEPEKSTQATLGFRFEPNQSFTFGADLWTMSLKNAIGQLTEDLVFANPGRFPGSFTKKTELGTGITYLAFLADNRNLGDQNTTGIDLDFSARMKTSFGLLTGQFTMTHMIRDESQLEKDGPFYSSIGNFAELGLVTLQNKGRLATTLKTADWSHTLGLNFQSGYLDQETDVELLNAAGNVVSVEQVRVQVPTTYTADWQTTWAPAGKPWSVTGGVLNLFDTAPPFVPSTGGASRGQTFGYDTRYFDPRGRTFYINASYKF